MKRCHKCGGDFEVAREITPLWVHHHKKHYWVCRSCMDESIANLRAKLIAEGWTLDYPRDEKGEWVKSGVSDGG